MVVFLVETTNGRELDIAVDMNETMCELLNRIGDEQPDRLMFLVPCYLSSDSIKQVIAAYLFII